MNPSDLKNMIVLKNLPSNIVEEAIIVLKANKKVKNLEKIEKNKNIDNKQNIKKESDYILKEAEMLVSNYISKLEEKKSMNNNYQKKANRKYKRIKNYAYVISFVALIESLIILMK